MSSRPRLLIIAFSTIVADARVLKQVDRLSRDYDVVTLGYGTTPSGVVQHLRISDDHPVWRWSRTALVLRRYQRAYWSNPAVSTARALLTETKVDAVLANDVESAGLALEVVPPARVHLDLHEYAPRQKEDVARWRLFVAPFVRWQIRRFVRRAVSTTTVGGRIAQEYRSRFGLDPEVVTNAAPYRDLSPLPVGKTIRLVHSGAALADRGILAIIDGVEESAAAVTLDLYLTPNDPAFLEEVRARVAASRRSTLHEPVPYDQLHTTLNGFDVGVHLLPPVNFNNANALPNKFFDYVQSRLGVVVGPSPEMAGIVVERTLGAVTDGFDSESLRAVLDALDPSTVGLWKAAAHSAARSLSSDDQVEGWARAIGAISPPAPR